MKRIIIFVGITLYATLLSYAQADKSESGYLYIKNTEKQELDVSLESTKVDVQIDGVIANVTVKQTYVNRSKKKLEAVYIFPSSTRAAVYGMKMRVGKRTIVAKIKEKQQARKEYNKAKEEGKTAGLLEQERPNVFQMNVANIAPGDTVSVDMTYTELLEYTDNLYEFVYPGVVGPRYDTGGEEWVAQSHNEPPTKGSFGINVNIRAGMPVDEVKCTSHEISTSQVSNVLNVTPANPKDYDSSKDFILKYGLRGGKVQSGMLTYQHKDENFFLLMVQPPKKVEINEIPPREYIFIVDVSGSMHGFPIELSKQIMRNLISSLRPIDRFNVMLFESSNSIMSEESLPATAENIEKAIRVINEQRGSGGTELYPALKKAFEFKTNPNFARTFIIATDGYVTVEKEAFALTQKNRNKFNLFALGIGSDVNRYLIEGLAYAGGGQPYIINSETEAETVGKRLINDISTPVLSHININWSNFGAYDITPSPVSDLFEGKPIVVWGKYKGNLAGNITIKGTTGAGEFSQTVNVAKAEKTKSQALRYLWARDKARYLSDYANYFEKGSDYYYEKSSSAAHKKQITNLGLKYSLMTDYTSFLATDNGRVSKPKIGEEVIIGSSEQYYDIGFAKFNSEDSKMAVEVVEYIQPKTMVAEEVVKEEVIPFSIVEQKPTFMGGDPNQFAVWIMKNIKLPETDDIYSGKIFISFTIDVKGNVSNIKIIRGLHPLIDAEILRVVKLSPKWIPAKQRNKAVPVNFVLPITINFSEE